MFTLGELAQHLEAAGWYAPVYHLPPDNDQVEVLRIVVRAHFNRTLARALLHDLEAAVQQVTETLGTAYDAGTAITNRTLSFGAQPLFPSGIDGTQPGPFRRVFLFDSANPCTNGQEPANGRQNGIVFFPGSVPLYRDGVLIGGYGVSGDGVEQDDIVSNAGANAAPGFEPPSEIRADQVKVRGVRLPYLKFNRQPNQ